MSNIWGEKVKYSIFGESHGDSIGIVIDGIKAGTYIEEEIIKFELKRRAPGGSNIATGRLEDDEFQILSGLFNGKSTGAPICITIKNKDHHSKDYDKIKNLMRPGHGDYTGNIKHNGFNDYRGGGYFSGRITAPLVIAGAISKGILKEKNIVIGSHILSIKGIKDISFNPLGESLETLINLNNMEFPLLNREKEIKMKNIILEAKSDLDSVGGIIECMAINIPVGLGEPFFDSFESNLSKLLFSIPGVKGVEFGMGFDITKEYGSKSNDEFYIEEGKVKTYSNNNGGILGGISSGMPIVFRVAMKPTPSIGKKQRTVDIENGKNDSIEIKGRHDPCIAVRALPVIEAVTAMAILDFI